MTKQQYIDRLRDKTFVAIWEQLREHDASFSPQEEHDEYWLLDLKLAVTPGDGRRSSVNVKAHGHALEITADWPYYIFFRRGCLILGNRTLPLESFERAVEAIRYLDTILPKHICSYNRGVADAQLELEKNRMMAQICESTIAPALEPMAEAAGLKCEVRGTELRITVKLVHPDGRNKYFYFDYNNPMNHLDEVKNYLRESDLGMDGQEQSN